ncbi:DUF7530 family protein [Halorarum salinum]|uniref:Uncharacterized protein n=1 Tax=Halorarum salinum TaxID=2743089 RepID=A0A7D5QEW4_9EURY|nr:hypothetical protein [Halobaculum salinum]QLG61002.1 hypothetical protein HUG12_04320 [Halobaculum salinum]
MSRGSDPTDPVFAEAWTYESIVSALPGTKFSMGTAVALQVAIFEGGLLVLAAAYDLWNAVPAGTAAVVVAAAGSYLMTSIAASNRTVVMPDRYYRLLFGSSIEVVLAVLAFSALVTHLFVFDPLHAGTELPAARLLPFAVDPAPTPLVTTLFGTEPPVPAVFFALLVLWDLCYRIGTSWWAAVVSIYRELRLGPTGESAVTFRRIEWFNVAFAVVQLALVPVVLDRPVLLLVVSGHVLAVTTASVTAIALSIRRER